MSEKQEEVVAEVGEEVIKVSSEEEEEPATTNVVQDAIAVVDVSKYNLNIFNEVYGKLRGMIDQKQFNAGNWITLLTMSMEMVETIPHLSGKEKRSLVVDLLTKLVGEIPMAEHDRALIQGILSSSLPAIIDAICDSSLGAYAINLAQNAHAEIKGCYNSCLGVKSKSRKNTHRKH